MNNPFAAFQTCRNETLCVLFKKIALLWTICMLPLISSVAQELTIFVTGDVRDAFLKTPLPEARLTLLAADSVTVIQDSVPLSLQKDEKGVPTRARYSIKLHTAGNYLLHASLDGYTEVWQHLPLADITELTVWSVDPLELKRERKTNLDEVSVTATRVKMYYRGDTLVYNADAFNLPDGSMLDDLIRQLPGVTMNKQGEIFVNGRKVDELQLESRKFFQGNSKVLMENLPYYVVKEVQVYEQESDRDRALGTHIDSKSYVMDVKLKREYSYGFMANVEAAGGTEDRYLTRGFLLGFTKSLRLTLYGNVNNVNEERRMNGESHWKPQDMPLSLLTTRSVAGEMDYQSEDETVKDNLLVEYASTEEDIQKRQRKELFLEGSTPRSVLNASSLNKGKKVSARNELTLSKPNSYYAKVKTDLEYKKYSGQNSSLSEEYGDTLLTRLRESGISSGHLWNGHVGLENNLKVGKVHVASLLTNLTYKQDKTEQARKYSFEAPSPSGQYNADDISHSSTELDITGMHCFMMKKRSRFYLWETVNIMGERAHDWLYHPDTLFLPSQLDALASLTDPRNSYTSRLNRQRSRTQLTFQKSEILKPDSMMTLGYPYERWDCNYTFTYTHQSLDYQRGVLDTLAKRSGLQRYASVKYRFFPKGTYNHDLQFNVSNHFGDVSLYDRISYQDDATPMVVKLGNPELKGNWGTTLKADYYSRTRARGRKYQRILHVGTSAEYRHRDISQSVTYNPQTTVYTYRPVNVHGNYHVEVKMDFTRLLDRQNRWTWQSNLTARLDHSVDHVLFEDQTESCENAVNTLTLHENTYLQYERGPLSLRATGDADWRHSEGRMRDFSTLNAIDWQYGLSGRYTLPRLKTTFSADMKMYSRRGYGSSTLNTDDFVLNASLSQPFLKGKLIARVEAFDLLHQLSSTQYTVNAQGRTETWYRSLPHYVMLHLVYHWNKNPKKQ